MKNRFFCVALVLTLIFTFSSCGDDKSGALEDSIVYVSVVSGFNEAFAAKEYSDSIDAQLLEYDSSADAVEAVRNNKADYVVLNEYEVQSLIAEDSELYYLESCEFKHEYRAVFKLDNEVLCQMFNDAFLELTENGTIDNIREAYLNGEVYQVTESTKEKGELVMVCDPSFEYRVYYDELGNLKGVDVDIAKEVCAYLGYDLVIITTDFHNMFIELEKGTADFIMSAVEYTEERAENFLFSDVYASMYYDVYTK